MALQSETVEYYIEDALIEINKILKKCKSGTVNSEDVTVGLEHALHMLNFAFNARNLSRKEASELSQDEYEKMTMPPKEIFDN